MTEQEKAAEILADPLFLGHELGYIDFKRGIHDKWIKKMVSGSGDMTLQAHRGSYKTTCLCVAIALMMIKERSKNIIFLRKTDDDIVEVVKNIARILQEPIFKQIYAALTGEQLELIKKTNAELTLGCYTAPRGAAQLQGIGVNGSLTGKHADIIITDDIVNLRDRISRAERDHTKAIYQELQNIRNPGGRIINTGTPWHKEDAFMLMPTADKWDYRRTGLLSDEKIKSLRDSMSPSLFAANYELQHIAAENALFETSPNYCKLEKDEDGNEINPLLNGIAHIDAAYGGEDYTAFTLGRRDGNILYIYGRLWHTHIDKVLSTILAECQRFGCAPIYCEDNADKGFLAKEIRQRNETMPVRRYHESSNKFQKISEYLRKWWQNIRFIDGTDSEYIAQIMDYTEDAEHDDAPDSAACVCRILDRRGLGEYKSVYGGVIIK